MDKGTRGCCSASVCGTCCTSIGENKAICGAANPGMNVLSGCYLVLAPNHGKSVWLPTVQVKVLEGNPGLAERAWESGAYFATGSETEARYA